VGFDGEVVVYHDEHVVIGTVNHGYAYVVLNKKHCVSMIMRPTGQAHRPGSRDGECSGPSFTEAPNNRLCMMTEISCMDKLQEVEIT
jgi:hypothetical protein